MEDPRPTLQHFFLLMEGCEPWSRPSHRREPGDDDDHDDHDGDDDDGDDGPGVRGRLNFETIETLKSWQSLRSDNKKKMKSRGPGGNHFPKYNYCCPKYPG